MALTPILSLVLRTVTLAFIVSSPCVFLVKNEHTPYGLNLQFLYALLTMCLGAFYTLVQVLRCICHLIKRGNTIGANGSVRFDFYGDKVTSYLLLSGASALLAVTYELDTNQTDLDHKIDYTQVYISFGLLVVGFLGTVISSVFSSYSLIQRKKTSPSTV